MTKEYNEGWRAYEDGALSRDNPYALKEKNKYDQWRAGYIDAKLAADSIGW